MIKYWREQARDRNRERETERERERERERELVPVRMPLCSFTKS